MLTLLEKPTIVFSSSALTASRRCRFVLRSFPHRPLQSGAVCPNPDRRPLAVVPHTASKPGWLAVGQKTEIRRVFRIIETTRHAERNRLCFVLSLYSGLRVGEIAALTVADVATQNGDVRREIKLEADQTKGPKGRTVVLSERVRKELGSFLKSQPNRHGEAPLIASQRNGRAFTNVSLSMLFKEIYQLAGAS